MALNEGHTLALFGRKGAGKTTLINTLASATRQSGGLISLGGVALHGFHRICGPRREWVG